MTVRTLAPRFSTLFVAGWLVTLALGPGCGGTDIIDHDDDDDDSQSQACSDINWRNPTDSAVTCPLTPDCSCQGGTVCCADVNAEQQLVTAAACQLLVDCAGVAMACDGPEDCGGQQVCCAEGMELSCRDAIDCHGIDTYVMCRTNEDCGSTVDDTCVPAVAGSYLENLVGFCD